MRVPRVPCLAALLVGCAAVHVYPVANETGSEGRRLGRDDSGVHFYRPALYVWITAAPPSEKVNVVSTTTQRPGETTETTVSTAAPGYRAQLVWLPDYAQEYVIQWGTGLGSVRPRFELEDGWNLTEFDSEAESRAAETIGETAGAITSLAPLAAGGLTKTKAFQGAGLYRLQATRDGRLELGARVLPLE